MISPLNIKTRFIALGELVGKQIATGSSIKAYHSFFLFGKFLALIMVGSAAWKILEYLVKGEGYKNSAMKS